MKLTLEDAVREGDFLIVDGFNMWAVSQTGHQGVSVIPYTSYRGLFRWIDTDRAPTDREWIDFCNTFGFKPAITPAPQKPDLETRLRAWIGNMRNDPVMAMLDEPANERQEYVLKELEEWLDAV